jgi:tetratricopeptide (TPR) repeat protein
MLAESWIVISLLVNGAGDASVARGEPIELSVNLSDLSAAEREAVAAERADLDARLAAKKIDSGAYAAGAAELDARLVGLSVYTLSAAEAWAKAVRLERYDDGARTWSPLVWKVVLDHSEGSAVDEAGYRSASFSIDPAEADGIAPGAYRVRATSPARDATSARDLVLASAPAMVTVTGVPMTDDDVEGQLRLARFSLARGDGPGAERHARAVVARRPNDEVALEYLGDALALQGKFRDAMIAYTQAHAAFEKMKLTEEPVVLEHKMDALAARSPEAAAVIEKKK